MRVAGLPRMEVDRTSLPPLTVSHLHGRDCTVCSLDCLADKSGGVSSRPTTWCIDFRQMKLT
jgi:hypothetical protein